MNCLRFVSVISFFFLTASVVLATSATSVFSSCVLVAFVLDSSMINHPSFNTDVVDVIDSSESMISPSSGAKIPSSPTQVGVPQLPFIETLLGGFFFFLFMIMELTVSEFKI